MLVKDVMAIGVVTISPAATVSEAARLMHAQNVGMLVVGDGSSAEGVVTDRDLLVACVGEYHHPKTCQVGKHTSKPVITTTPTADLLEAARVMRRHRFRRLPVVEPDGQLVGVVSFSDIARALEQSIHDVLIGMTSPPKAIAPVKVGEVSHYYSKLSVAALTLERPIRKGDLIYVVGHTTDLEQRVESMEINHQPVEYATPGDQVAIKLTGRARAGDTVYIDAEAA